MTIGLNRGYAGALGTEQERIRRDAYASVDAGELEVDIGITTWQQLALRVVCFQLHQQRPRAWLDRIGGAHQLCIERPSGVFGKPQINVDAGPNTRGITLRNLDVNPQLAKIGNAEELGPIATAGV